MTENSHYRNQEPSLAVIDLYYIITPYSDTTGVGETPNQIEQQMLSDIIRTFHNAQLKAPMLSKELVESENKELNIYLNNLSTDETYKIWSMFRDVSYKLCLSYLVTPVRIPVAFQDSAVRVTSEKIEIEEMKTS